MGTGIDAHRGPDGPATAVLPADADRDTVGIVDTAGIAGSSGLGDPTGTMTVPGAATAVGIGAAREDPPQVPGLPGVPQTPTEIVARSTWVPTLGQPTRYKWAFTAIWLIYLVGPVIEVAGDAKPAWWKALNYFLVVFFSAVYCALSILSFRRGLPQNRVDVALPLVLTLFVTSFVSCVFVNSHLIGMWVYVGSGSGLSLPLSRKYAQRVVLMAVAGVTFCSWLGHLSMSDWLSVMFPTFFAGLATIGIRQMATLIADLREAREQVARLATNEERLRMARDLHDLTGHSLSMITLKAQLAQRLLARVPETRDVAAAIKEVTEIEEASRQSLTDIRETVSGYRRPTLAVELSSACAALGAAGIGLDADPAVTAVSGTCDPDVEAVLAWCLREGVTNVIRHSGATRVRVRLAVQGGELVLSIQNDGRGLAATAGTTDTVGGNGLAGLRERLDAVDGRLTVGGCDGDFRMVAAVPLPVPVVRA